MGHRDSSVTLFIFYKIRRSDILTLYSRIYENDASRIRLFLFIRGPTEYYRSSGKSTHKTMKGNFREIILEFVIPLNHKRLIFRTPSDGTLPKSPG